MKKPALWRRAFQAAALDPDPSLEPMSFADGARWIRDWIYAFIAMGEWAARFEYDEDDCSVGAQVMTDAEINQMVMSRPSSFRFWEQRERTGFYMGNRQGEVVGAALVAWGWAIKTRDVPCVVCKTTGKRSMLSFSDPKKRIVHRCTYCRGSGWIQTCPDAWR